MNVLELFVSFLTCLMYVLALFCSKDELSSEILPCKQLNFLDFFVTIYVSQASINLDFQSPNWKKFGVVASAKSIVLHPQVAIQFVLILQNLVAEKC